jgi:hypothetical protein
MCPESAVTGYFLQEGMCKKRFSWFMVGLRQNHSGILDVAE